MFIPVIGQPCSLFCKPKDPRSRFSAKLASKVIDGTPCRPGSIDICIDGRCQVSYNSRSSVVRKTQILPNVLYKETYNKGEQRRDVLRVVWASVDLSIFNIPQKKTKYRTGKV